MSSHDAHDHFANVIFNGAMLFEFVFYDFNCVSCMLPQEMSLEITFRRIHSCPELAKWTPERIWRDVVVHIAA